MSEVELQRINEENSIFGKQGDANIDAKRKVLKSIRLTTYGFYLIGASVIYLSSMGSNSLFGIFIGISIVAIAYIVHLTKNQIASYVLPVILLGYIFSLITNSLPIPLVPTIIAIIICVINVRSIYKWRRMEVLPETTSDVNHAIPTEKGIGNIKKAEKSSIQVYPNQHSIERAKKHSWGQAKKDPWEKMTNKKQNDDILLLIIRLTSGRYGLVKTFWIYLVFVGVVFSAFKYAAINAHENTIFTLLTIAHYIYLPFVLVGIWKASTMYMGPAIWKLLSKLVVVANFAMMPIGIYMQFIQ
jgi:hypothetical protein